MNDFSSQGNRWKKAILRFLVVFTIVFLVILFVPGRPAMFFARLHAPSRWEITVATFGGLCAGALAIWSAWSDPPK